MMKRQMCFDCLQRRIQSDFSDKLIFSYGICDSALPFGTRAVVKVSVNLSMNFDFSWFAHLFRLLIFWNLRFQMPNASGEAASEFMVVYLPRHEDDCLTRYV